MQKFILSLILSFIGFSLQAQHNILLDTMIHGDAVYLDPLNQIYIINDKEKSITKFKLPFQFLKRTGFNQGWDRAIMDVSDPFKSILYYPGDFKIRILDESLAEISMYDESELNSESAVSHFTTDYIAIYSNNFLKLKNYAQQKTISSDRLSDFHSEKIFVSTLLKQSDEYLYLLKPGSGITRYTNQLFEDLNWLIPDVEQFDVNGDDIYYLKQGEIIKLNASTADYHIMWKGLADVHGFAANSQYIVVLNGDRLQMISTKIRE
jgi:hypothetical protein